jgi:SAM-dependent methyltransferase
MENRGIGEAIKKLDDEQVEAFDTEYVSDSRWEVVKSLLERDFPDGEFSFLDIGGGNGKFADRLLAQYPKSKGTVLDNSEVLLGRNQPDDRKVLVSSSVENLVELNEKYDLICVHWLLHHIVCDSYTKTRQAQNETLHAIRELLTPRGRVSMFENIYTGWVINSLPGRMIYQLTSNKMIAVLTRKLGANTAGVGVCFLSRGQWLASIKDAGLQVLAYTEPDKWVWPLKLEWRIFLHIKHVRVGHFWLTISDI